MNKALVLSIFCFLQSSFCIAQAFTDTLILLLENNKSVSELEANPCISMRRTLYNAYVKPSNAFSEFGIKNYLGIFNNGIAKNSLDLVNDEENFILNLRVKNDTIVLATLSACIPPKYDKVKRIYTKIDTTLANHLLMRHNSRYFSKWTLQDLIKNNGIPTASGLDIPGFLSPVSQEAIELAKLIATKNHLALFLLASSLEPECRAAGTIGLFGLEQDGKILSKEEKELIATNQSAKVNITITQGDYTREDSMSSWLSDVNMRYYISYFKDIKPK